MSMLPKGKNQRVLVQLVGVVLVMGALAWAAVPFYNWFCRVTGYGGTTQVAASHDEAADITDEDITIRFDGNIDPNLPWTFRPMQTEMTLKIGQDGLAFYEAVNNSDKPITGRASGASSRAMPKVVFCRIVTSSPIHCATRIMPPKCSSRTRRPTRTV